MCVEREDVAECCICHNYTWWNNPGGKQMETVCENYTIRFIFAVHYVCTVSGKILARKLATDSSSISEYVLQTQRKTIK